MMLEFQGNQPFSLHLGISRGPITAVMGSSARSAVCSGVFFKYKISLSSVNLPEGASNTS